MTTWKDKFIELDMRTCLREFRERLRPYSLTGKASFGGFSDAALGRGDAMEAYYGNNRQLLQQVKRIWDRDNYFQPDQGISMPSAAATLPDAQAAAQELEEALSDEDIVDDEDLTDLAAQSGWDIRTFTPRFERLTHNGPPEESELETGTRTNENSNTAFVFHGEEGDIRMRVRAGR